ncbi:MAG: hypothetical protein ACE5GX_15085 [Thermoanaerobaculia bacterium]
MQRHMILAWFAVAAGLTLAMSPVVNALEEPVESKAVFELRDALRSTQRTYTGLKSPIRSRVTDSRFNTKMALYLANEEILSGNGFLEKALQKGLVERTDMDFIHMTASESYWYSRYNLSWLLAKSRMGIHIVHGPYLTLKAMEREGRVLDNRPRGELNVANRQVLLDQVIPVYLRRTGFPERFLDASPVMLEYASGDPRLTRGVDVNDDLDGNTNGQVDFEESYLTLRWNHDRIDTTIDLGGVGQTLAKQVLWMEYFFKQNHLDGQLLGNDAEEGFRGAMLNLMAVSKMLLLKSALFYDGKRLEGVHPFRYDPEKGLAYLPHALKPRLIMAGDIPPRAEWFTVKDPSSQLFDQASLLWGTSRYFYFADPQVKDNYDNVFGENTPYDGSIMEQKWQGLAHGLANVLLKNILVMHREPASGLLVSEWTPKGGVGASISLQDAGMAMIALADYGKLVNYSPELQQKAMNLLGKEADFLLAVQGHDGSFYEAYEPATGRPLGAPHTLLAQGFAVRGLLRAYEVLGDRRFYDAAGRTMRYMNDHLWHEGVGIYRSSQGATTTVYTPMNLGAALGALRDWILASEDRSEVKRYKRFHVQGLNRSGILLAEEGETGETQYAANTADTDGDGIAWFGKAGQRRHGVAAVHASRVEIDTGDSLPTVVASSE